LDEGKDPNLVEDPEEEAATDTPFDPPRLLRLFLCYLGDVWIDYVSGKDDFAAQRAEFMDIFGKP
jgi:hypothetical protein